MILKNFEINKKPENPFKITKASRKNPAVDFRINGKNKLEKSLIITLSICIIILLISPNYKIRHKNIVPGSNVIVYTDVIPQTLQNAQRRRQPEKPAVPIEAETEEMAEDITIDFEYISFSDLPPMPGNVRGVPDVTIGPRIIKQVVPSISSKDKKNGVKGSINISVLVDHTGKVIDVIILESTIEILDVKKAVVAAAYRCFFIPARRGARNVKDRSFIKYDIDFSR